MNTALDTDVRDLTSICKRWPSSPKFSRKFKFCIETATS